ncbi:MAG TPA: hypothetical protein VGI88_14060, partial [Verrucomicrobiae bacterium]
RFAIENDVWLSYFSIALVTIALASFVYRFFEQPIIKFYKRKFSPSAGAQTIPSAAPTTLNVEEAGALPS